VGEVVVTVDDTTPGGRPLDALKQDPNAGRQLRDLSDVDAGAPRTGPAVHTPAMFGVQSIGRRRPTYDEHHANRRAVVEAGTYVCEAFDPRCGEPRSGRRGAASTTIVELVESRIRDLIPGDQ
jgi:hypothetical protein